MCLLFNMLSKFVIAFLPKSKCLLISWLQSPYEVILEPKKIKSIIASIFFNLSPNFAIRSSWWKWESEKVGLKLIIQKTKIPASGLTTSWQIDGETMADVIFWGSKITADGDCSHKIKRRLLPGRKVMTNLDSILKSRHYFANKGPSSHVWLWESDRKESWALKNWCFWTVVLEKTLESPLDSREI